LGRQGLSHGSVKIEFAPAQVENKWDILKLLYDDITEP